MYELGILDGFRGRCLHGDLCVLHDARYISAVITRATLSAMQKRQGEPVINHQARWRYSSIQMWRLR